jgi:single-strand DNA-binding protein
VHSAAVSPGRADAAHVLGRRINGMNKVMLVGRLTRDPELRTLPSSKHVANFVIATNEYRGTGAGERTEYHNLVAWDRLAEICGQFLSKGQLVDIEGRLQTRQWDDDAGVRHWKTEVVVNQLEMLSGRGKKEYAKEAQTIAEAGPDGHPAEAVATNGAGEVADEALVAL